ncbi:GH1 family beta-glucosidase [Nostocoides vanveenii]|uniref:Beta-glucosidase n=1 Tax=Nostocoides vanveenii TaxID=330835 RepID=A0ABN2KHZ4_9MICO
MSLPADFLFGVSTASYQIEGAVDAEGRGRSVWDDFCDRPGVIVDGSSGAVACDSYHRYAEDVELMAQLGAAAYRFSVSWSRVLPQGRGPINQAGLDYYDRLVDALCAEGIKPAATLFHWDLPSTLEAEGGWLSRSTAEAFGTYAGVLADRLGDRVAMWMPVNEPVVHANLGYALGLHAPGRALGMGALPVYHHLMLGHGLAVAALRAAGVAAVGCANNHTPVWVASDADADQAAAGLYDTLHNRMFADPILLGSYPAPFAELVPGPVADDLQLIGAPLDFYGFNYYNPTLVGAPGTGDDTYGAAGGLPFSMHQIEGYPVTDFGWPVVPAGLTEVLVQMKERYPDIPPIHITENGCAYGAAPDADGVAADPGRIDYLSSHLGAVADARAQGVDVAGYFCWSLLDNFEWAEGYTKRFGLVHIDFDTLARTPRTSFDWYADFIRRTRTD